MKLGNICSIRKGTKIEQIDAGVDTERYIQIDDLRNDDNLKYCAANKKYVFAKPDDIIIAWDGANAGTIGFGLNGAIGSTLAVISLNNNNFDTRYIGQLLRSKFIYLRDNSTGATIPHINRKSLENIQIPVKPLATQRKNANILALTAELLAMRKKQLSELDNLIKSTFYNMFGDPVANVKGWKVRRMVEVCSKITDGKHGDCEDEVASGYYFISAKDINNGTIQYIKSREITKADFEDTNKRTKLNPGDLVVVNTGATIGKTAIVTDDDRTYRTTFQKSVAIIQVIPSELSNQYLQYHIIIDRDNIYKSASGSAQKNWLLSQMRNYSVLLPPIQLQIQFTKITAKIEEQKALVKQAIDETQHLFDSLMSEYFE
ncbi:restriction endonuclease subunit S [Paenibacillus sp. 22594]|uniref:restriction endonuclease subunit S n=1 Tax=Paenibacillus sp. 22594 TaxID=3453947 RepID=UPI003F8254E9